MLKYFIIFYYNNFCLCLGRISLVVINSSIITERGSSFGLAVELLEKKVRIIYIIKMLQLNVPLKNGAWPLGSIVLLSFVNLLTINNLELLIYEYTINPRLESPFPN